MEGIEGSILSHLIHEKIFKTFQKIFYLIISYKTGSVIKLLPKV